jgi:GDPmannose 4,6-dehydratase
MWLMLQQDQPDDYIVATGHTFTLREFVHQVFARLDLDWQRYTSNDDSFLRPTDILISRADTSKAKNVLGWQVKYDMRDVARMMVEAELAEENRACHGV